MKNLKLHTPTGLTDLLPKAYQLKRSVERQLELVFERYGYMFISAPTLEYLAVFEGTGSIPAAQMFKLGDKNGDMLALRPDMTPAVARMATTQNFGGRSPTPLRLCYIEKIFRDHERFLGRENEMTQAGAELIGTSSPEADAEVIALAVHGLLAAGITKFRIDIGQVDFLPGVLAELETALSASERKAFINHMIRRDYVAAESIAAKAKHIVPAGVLLSDITNLVGGSDMIARAKSMVSKGQATAALTHLEEIYAILCDQGLQEYVLLDLSMTGQLDYYTGVIFKGYAEGSGSTVVDGGRYDKLLASFSSGQASNGSGTEPIPAIGFGIKIDGILDALSAQDVSFKEEYADTLLAYHESARAVALTTGDILRRDGLHLENSLVGGGLVEQKDYATSKGLKGILYFKDPNTVVLVDLEANTEKEVNVEEFIKC